MSIKSLVSLFLIFLFVGMLISFSSFVSAGKKFDVSVRVVENVEEENVSIEKETITPQKIVTGLVSLSFKDKNNIILPIVIILITVLIVYIIIRKEKNKRRKREKE